MAQIAASIRARVDRASGKMQMNSVVAGGTRNNFDTICKSIDVTIANENLVAALYLKCSRPRRPGAGNVQQTNR